MRKLLKHAIPSTALVCTLGSEPQVITLSLDLLARRGRRPDRLVVVHTSDDHEPVRTALEQLRLTLTGWPRLETTFVPVEGERGPVPDLATSDQAAAYLRTLYRTVLELKRAGSQVDLNLSGGRKPMSIYAVVVAQLLFDAGDRLWYLLSSETVRRSEQMRLGQADDADLLEIPVLRWSSVSPAATPLGRFEDPWDAIAYQQEHHLRASMNARRVFVNQVLTPAERDLARLAATTGLDNAALAERLNKRPKTIANQLNTIYGKLHEFLGFPDAGATDRTVLAAEFGPYFALEGEV